MKKSEEEYLIQVETFLDISKNLENSLVNLVSGIEGISNQFKSLNKINDLSEGLESMNYLIDQINIHNESIEKAFSNMESAENISRNIKDTNDNIDKLTKKFSDINSKTDEILNEISNSDYGEIIENFSKINERISKIEDTINVKIFDILHTDIYGKINHISNKHTLLLTEISQYKNDVNGLIIKSIENNKSFEEHIDEVIRNNKFVINSLNTLDDNNAKFERIINYMISNWYDSNIGILGNRKKFNSDENELEKILKEIKEGQNKKSNYSKICSTCPTCGKKLTIRRGPKNHFIGCSGYPSCNYTQDVFEEIQ